MGTILSAAAGLMLVYGGTFGVELVMARYATPEAQSQRRTEVRAPDLQDRISDPCPDDAADP